MIREYDLTFSSLNKRISQHLKMDSFHKYDDVNQEPLSIKIKKVQIVYKRKAPFKRRVLRFCISN